ncbi:alpha-methylacyl-CoA racemase [Kribbella aluminosa]|uniref:Alpha-methylacyl-CoA racemase n=1 Tax=Kribbella aluminosa TaxID=416017 RepID=A0ABS4V0M9_9ACTN|nr:CaiB/BaiF CoA-transferase family protein [Kribbella aluminosa]MBP2357468.1 alpha-methylacyl-CoA racemase [Kribbella aluminosa]
MGPLEGVKVVELAGIGPAPFACMLLAELGADVLRIDRPGGGPSMGPPELDLVNRGRRSAALDLKHPAAVDVVRRLVAQADVLVEGFRPGVAERLGLGPEDCRALNPRLVYGRMTGWGQDGPLAQTAGHDIDYLAVSGALHLIGRAGGPPQVPANLLGDFAGGSLYLVIGVLAALHEAQRSGQGQVVDAAIVDGSAHLTTMLLGALAAGSWRQERGTNLLDTGAPFYDVYETADGKHVAVGALEPRFYAELIGKLGLNPPDRDDPAQWPELRKVLTKTFRERTQAEWAELFDGSDACVAPVLPLAADHPHLVARGTFVDHHGVRQAAPAPRFGRTPTSLRRPPARPGEHTREALADWGITDVDALLESGAAKQIEHRQD